MAAVMMSELFLLFSAGDMNTHESAVMADVGLSRVQSVHAALGLISRVFSDNCVPAALHSQNSSGICAGRQQGGENADLSPAEAAKRLELFTVRSCPL